MYNMLTLDVSICCFGFFQIWAPSRRPAGGGFQQCALGGRGGVQPCREAWALHLRVGWAQQLVGVQRRPLRGTEELRGGPL